jgi:alkylation response protein AidB-like acyl-CoA dehydrogenase
VAFACSKRDWDLVLEWVRTAHNTRVLKEQLPASVLPRLAPFYFMVAERCYELMMQRTLERKTFGKYLWQHGGTQELIADSVADLESARLLTFSCAAAMDDVSPKLARHKIASIKVGVPELTAVSGGRSGRSSLWRGGFE